MDKIKTIVLKEWAEVFKNRLVLFTVAFLPIIFVALPLVTVAVTGGEDSAPAVSGELPDPFMEAVCQGIENPTECVQVYLLNLYTLLFLILPVSIPVTIAAYSIVGEKTTRSLEPLLATPITTAELIAGKALAAITPAILATWLAYAVFLVGARLLVAPSVFGRITDPLWLIAIFVVAPLLTLLSVSVAILISSRASDPRVAEQLSSVVVLPIILFIVGQSVGLIILNRQTVLVLALIVAGLDAGLMFLVVRLFQREVILTRWK